MRRRHVFAVAMTVVAMAVGARLVARWANLVRQIDELTGGGHLVVAGDIDDAGAP